MTEPRLVMDRESTAIYLGEIGRNEIGQGQIRVHFEGTPPASAKLEVYSDYQLQALSYTWVNQGQFPAVIIVRVDIDFLMNDDVPQEWITDRTTHGTDVVERDYQIPMHVYYGRYHTRFTLSLRTHYQKVVPKTAMEETVWFQFGVWFVFVALPWLVGAGVALLVIYLLVIAPIINLFS